MRHISHISLFSKKSITRVLLLTIVCSLLSTFTLSKVEARSVTPAHLPMSGRPFASIHPASQAGLPTPYGTGLKPPSDAMCRAQFQTTCYSPQEIWKSYDVGPLLHAGDVGKGQTIIVVIPFGSPTLIQDLHTFDQGYGLPDPPSIRIVAPLGSVPFDPTNFEMLGFAGEAGQDVEMAHAMAPGANIIELTSPVDETVGVQGLPELLAVEQYAVDHHLGNIISQSWSTTEDTLFTPAGKRILNAFNDFYRSAARQHITILTSASDRGASGIDPTLHTYPFRVVNFPSSSPWVTTVGGTTLHASTSGTYQNETVWNDNNVHVGIATGGGVSKFFAEPDYQKKLPLTDQNILQGHRGLPDLALTADPFAPNLGYFGFIPGQAGWYAVTGTSEAVPQWAGFVADIDQLAGHSLGFLNPALYALGKSQQAKTSFHDITIGNNTDTGITGYNAGPGWDPTTGWGTPKVTNLAHELVEQEDSQAIS